MRYRSVQYWLTLATLGLLCLTLACSGTGGGSTPSTNSSNNTPSTSGSNNTPSTSGSNNSPSTSGSNDTPSGVSAPVFTSTPPTTLAQGTTTYSYTIAATDPAGTQVTYALTPSPTPTASISGNVLTWTPAASELLMPTTFTVTATTALGGTQTQTWTVTPYRQVTVSLIDNFWGPAGPATDPLPGIAMGALVPGSATPLTATDNGNGTYTINNVPAGYYWLTAGATEKYWTNTGSFDIGTDYVGNAISSSPSAMSLTITSLTIDPFASGDAIWVGSPAENTWYAPTTQPATGAATPQTYTDTETIAAGTIPPIESGDTSYVLEYESPGTGNANYVGYSLVGSQIPPTGIPFGTSPTPITGSLTDASPATLDLSMSGWGSEVPSAEQGASATFFGTYLWPLPFTTTSSPSNRPSLAASGGGFPTCIVGSANVPCTGALAGFNGWPSGTGPEPATIGLAPHNDRQPGSPGPLYVAWAERCYGSGTDTCEGAADGDAVTLTFNPPSTSFSGFPYVLWSQQEMSVPIPSFSVEFTANSISAVEFSSLPTSATTLSPVITPVQSPMIGNTASTTGSLFIAATVNATPYLSWTAPTSGNAIGYHIAIYPTPSSPSGAWTTTVADLYTQNTSVTVPAGVLSAGSQYVFVVYAVADAHANLATSPWRSSYPMGVAPVVSGLMTIN